MLSRGIATTLSSGDTDMSVCAGPAFHDLYMYNRGDENELGNWSLHASCGISAEQEGGFAPEPMMRLLFEDKRLTTCVLIVWLVITCGTFSMLGVSHVNFMHVGPGENTKVSRVKTVK